MKKKLLVILLVFYQMTFSQVAIGKSSLTVIPSTTTPNPGISLEFGNIAGNASTQKGIILPWVAGKGGVTGVVPGTLVFDATDKKAYFYKGGGTPTWVDLTVDTTGVVDTSIQDGKTDFPKAKVSIGSPVTPDVPGILVLEDPNKAMVLPLVDKYTSVVSPAPGMMVYDLANNMICFYNGATWSYWTQ